MRTEPDLVCPMDGCARRIKSRGLCGTHYERWRRHGDPTVVKSGGPPPGPRLDRRVERPGVMSVHSRLRRERGKASEHVCPCGQPAQEWAYDHTDPDEYLAAKNGRMVPVSVDPARYVAMCRPCHRRLDHPGPLGRTCDVPECERKHHARGLCQGHFDRRRSRAA